MPKPMLWMSIATTGTGVGGDLSTAYPTEIAAMLTNDRMGPVDASFDRILITKAMAEVLKSDKEAVKILKRDQALHVKHPEAVTVLAAEANILEMLDEAGVDEDHTLPIAGRGADRFLLPVIQIHMPNLYKRLDTWTFDASQLARWARACDGLSLFRQHAPDLTAYEDILEALPPFSEATFRETLTAAHQFRAVMKENS